MLGGKNCVHGSQDLRESVQAASAEAIDDTGESAAAEVGRAFHEFKRWRKAAGIEDRRGSYDVKDERGSHDLSAYLAPNSRRIHSLKCLSVKEPARNCYAIYSANRPLLFSREKW
jgi:hypothetical protein